MNNYKQSFEALVGDKTNILILGSIPGDKSIAENEYYAHPQNRFWRIICLIFKHEYPLSYNEKKAILKNNNISLWDVAHSAIRQGSLDADIRKEVPNNINEFILENTDIKIVAFNGKKAMTMYDKYFKRLSHIKYVSLPSTSPANARYKLDDLLNEWKILLK